MTNFFIAGPAVVYTSQDQAELARKDEQIAKLTASVDLLCADLKSAKEKAEGMKNAFARLCAFDWCVDRRWTDLDGWLEVWTATRRVFSAS